MTKSVTVNEHSQNPHTGWYMYARKHLYILLTHLNAVAKEVVGSWPEADFPSLYISLMPG